jgi:hypothetical protein
MERQPLPFDDRSVSYIFSSHFLEHTTKLDAVLAEISRVCADGAQLELWTPYSWHNHGLLPGHTTFFMEEFYYHVCVYHREVWQKIVVGADAHWVLNRIHYSISEETLGLLRQKNIGLEFALKHMINIASEFCAYITVWRSQPPDPYPPFQVTYSDGRGGERHELAEMEIITTSPPSLRPKLRQFEENFQSEALTQELTRLATEPTIAAYVSPQEPLQFQQWLYETKRWLWHRALPSWSKDAFNLLRGRSGAPR